MWNQTGRLKKRFRGQKRKESIGYTTTVGLAITSYREEKGKMLEDKKRWPNRSEVEQQSEN